MEHPEILAGIGERYRKTGLSLLLRTTGSRRRAFDWCQNQRPWRWRVI